MFTGTQEGSKCAPAENSQPVCTCRRCGGTLDAQYQVLGLPHNPGYWFLTCWNKSCALYSVTRSASSYSTFDLTPYLKD